MLVENRFQLIPIPTSVAPPSSLSVRSRRRRSVSETLRALLLGVVALTALGLGVELAFLEHWTAAVQLTPLVVLSLSLAACGALAFRPGPGTVRLFRWIMALAVVAGLAGLGFHLSDNLAFEREVAPDAALGRALWAAFYGATPFLAPGSLVQLGLVGLILTYRHPALAADPTPPIQEHP